VAVWSMLTKRGPVKVAAHWLTLPNSSLARLFWTGGKNQLGIEPYY